MLNCFLGPHGNNILKMNLTDQLRCVSNETNLCTAWVQVLSADIPMKIMSENTPSVHLTVAYTEELFDNWRRSGQPKYVKNEEWFASF